MSQKRNNMMKQMQEENKRLAQEKRDRENAWKKDQEKQNQFEIATTNDSDIMTENRQTTVSKHADHRYMPYHFKGLRPDQIAQIDAERQQQVRDHKVEKAREKEEEMMWAMQQEANRQLMLQNEMDLSEKQKQMSSVHRDQHKGDKVVKDQRWTNYYGEQNQLPHVE